MRGFKASLFWHTVQKYLFSFSGCYFNHNSEMPEPGSVWLQLPDRHSQCHCCDGRWWHTALQLPVALFSPWGLFHQSPLLFSEIISGGSIQPPDMPSDVHYSSSCWIIFSSSNTQESITERTVVTTGVCFLHFWENFPGKSSTQLLPSH